MRVGESRRRGWIGAAVLALVLVGAVWGLRPHAQWTQPGPPAAAVPDAAGPIDVQPADVRATAASAVGASLLDSDGIAAGAALDAHFRRVLREGDPRQRLIALRALAVGKRDPRMRQWARAEAARLRAEAPDDPLIALAQGWFCGGAAPPCTPEELGAWERTESGNAAALVDALGRARQSPEQQDILLRRMAAGGGYETHYRALVLETIAAFDNYVPPPPRNGELNALREAGLGTDTAARRQMLATAYVAALPLPPLTGISNACRPPIPTQRMRDCHAVLLRMARAHTLAERMVALSALERLTRGAPENLRWVAEVRRLRWWFQQLGSLLTGPAYWEDFMRHGEVEAVRRALLRAGRPLDPPAGWQPLYR